MRLGAPLFLSAVARAAATPDHGSPGICPRKDVTSLLTGTSHNTCPLPTTGFADPSTEGPWTHPPRCTTTDTQTYCVYTTTTHGHNGLSLIATPEAASALTPILTQIYHSSFPSQASARNLNLQPAADVQDIPGKDKGLVATRFIAAKETFLLDYASLVVSAEFPPDVQINEAWEMMDVAADRLADPGAVRGLGAMGRSENVVEDVMQTNTFKSELEIGRSFVVFPFISRINHACKPNAFMRHSRSGVIAGISAFRDIHPGEEITISYIPLQEPSEDRKALLQKNWGFTCTCPLCTAPPSQLSADDARRSALKGLEEEAIAAIHARDLPFAKDALTRLAESFAAEGMWPLLQDIYHVLATVCWVMGQQDEAVGYVERKLDVRDDYARLEVGDRTAELEEEMRWIGRPR